MVSRLLPWLAAAALSIAGCADKNDDTNTPPGPEADADTDADADADTDADADADTDADTDADPTFELFINEFMASNASYVFDGPKDKDGDPYTPDWIELYNPGDAPVNLKGYSISDDFEITDKHVFGELPLPAGGFVLLYADDMPELGADHLPFQLSAPGEQLGLYDPDGVPLDLIEFTNQATDISAARIPDGGSLSLTSNATPGESNNTAKKAR